MASRRGSRWLPVIREPPLVHHGPGIVPGSMAPVGDDPTGAGERDSLVPRGSDHDRLRGGGAGRGFADPVDQKARRGPASRIAFADVKVERGQGREPERRPEKVAN